MMNEKQLVIKMLEALYEKPIHWRKRKRIFKRFVLAVGLNWRDVSKDMNFKIEPVINVTEVNGRKVTNTFWCKLCPWTC